MLTQSSPPVRAAIYLRVSSVMQLDNYSLEAQMTACRRLAVERGWKVVVVFSDEGESAKTTERPKFRDMMRRAFDGQFDVIVVHKLDRLSRSVVDVLTTLHDLEELHVALVSATEQFDFTTPIGRAMLTMLAVFAQWYLDNLSAETAKGKRARAEAGLWNGMVPFGYTVRYKKDGGDGIPYPDERDALGVRLAFEKYATGSYSDNDIAKLLNEEGYRPHGRGQRAMWVFGKDALAELLQNRFYLGEVQYKGKWYPGVHEPIVSAALFEQCQSARVKRRVRVGTTAPDNSREYILAGVARCARCGGFLRGNYSQASKKRYYRDPARQQGRECDQSMIGADKAEKIVGEALCRVALPADWQKQVMTLIEVKLGKRSDSERDRERLETQLGRIKYLFKLGDLSQQEYLVERKRLQARLAAIAPQARPDLSRAPELLHDLSAIWNAATLLERRQITLVLLEAVYLDCKRGPVVEIVPKPEFKVLFEAVQANGARVTTLRQR